MKSTKSRKSLQPKASGSKAYGTELTLESCGWCYLSGLYDFKTRSAVLPPKAHKGTYSAEDPDGTPYLALSQGKRNGRDLFDRWSLENGLLSLVYPERVFAYAHDLVSEGNRTRRVPVDRDRLLAILAKAGLRGEGFWHPALIHHGYAGGGPLFHHALRAHTDIGVGWYDVASKIVQVLEPDGWELVSGPYPGISRYEFYREHQSCKL